MTRHPLLLPILLLGQHQIQLRDMTEALWEDLLDVEKSGGQSGIDVIEEEEPSKDSHIPHTMATENKGMPSSFNVKTMTNSVLGVVQLATVWESHTKTLIAGIEIIQKTTMTVVDGMLLRGTEKHVRDGAPSPGNTAPTTSQPKPSGIEEEQEMVAISLNLKESLELILQKSNGMLWDLEFMNKRAGAQMTALYNHIAQQIATAAKQDSSDMKAIAILTMAFLPATFVATFFAMPLFDFDAAEEKTVVKSRFWYYFAVTGPLTVCVLVMYWLYGLRAQKKFKGSEGRANASVVRDRQMLGERANGGASVFGAFFPASSTRAAAGADLASKVRKRSGNGSTVDLERGIKVEASHDKALG
ncbi:hypothetical protein QBC47DRAFT_387148 [Echria macrotheca]|uniref:Uncharacterized protein n=1 Tax=Echria macrotheca TaxID=438768 RepID=A0AAJ0FA30_9PEZI|nr:hypothetical protein QBC47DRAFT_387148 [Echria macrotheca]